MTAIHSPSLDLPQLFSPAQAAEILRSLGLVEMTECALRTRAYRRQVPFHLNGRRVRFTADDLREIVEGHAHRPQPPTGAEIPPTTPPPAPRPLSVRSTPRSRETWRARSPRGNPSPDGGHPR